MPPSFSTLPSVVAIVTGLWGFTHDTNSKAGYFLVMARTISNIVLHIIHLLRS